MIENKNHKDIKLALDRTKHVVAPCNVAHMSIAMMVANAYLIGVEDTVALYFHERNEAAKDTG